MDRAAYLAQIDEVIAKGKYKDDWNSMKNIEVPEWYRNAKFGIFIHWGVYSVPAFRNEWYTKYMYTQGHVCYDHHLATYGPHSKFGYKDFIPMFKAENFDAGEWMDVVKSSGARYVMPVAEHHDGFQMYKSDISPFNAYEMGPKRDVLGELRQAALDKGIVFCASSHRIEHWFFMGHGKEFDSDIKEPLKRGDFYWPSMEEPEDIFDVNDWSMTDEFMEDWLIRSCEIVDKYQPRVFYFDWWIQVAPLKPYLKKFAAYYYNRCLEWGENGVINYKFDAFPYTTAIVDIERGQFASIQPRFWQTCSSVAKNSWGYTENNQYKTSTELICDLVDIVSKNGCLLLNIGPRADGTIPSEDKRILTEIGEWMKVNGEAVYDTNFFKVFGEGDTVIKEGMFTDKVTKEFTSADIRFTINGDCLYAFVLKYPKDGIVSIKTLAKGAPHFNGIIKNIQVLGFDETPEFERNEQALTIRTKGVISDNPVVFKIEMD